MIWNLIKLYFTPISLFFLAFGIFFQRSHLLLPILLTVIAIAALSFYLKKIKVNELLIILFFTFCYMYSPLYKQIKLYKTPCPCSVHKTLRINNYPYIKNKRWIFESECTSCKLNYQTSINIYLVSVPLHYSDLINGKVKERPSLQIRNPGGFNYGTYLKRKGLSGQLQITRIKSIKKLYQSPYKNNIIYKIKSQIFKLKQKILSFHSKYLPNPLDDLFSGLIFGDQGTVLPQKLKDDIKTLGLTHLMVVSGSQVALISGILALFLDYLRIKKVKKGIIITISNICFYILTGGGPSIFRAVLMNIMMIFMKEYGKKTTALHSLSFVALIMLLIDPQNLTSVSCQLSFAATSSLIYGVPFVEKSLLKKVTPFLKKPLALALAPFIYTSPILWANTQTLSFVSIFSNLLLVGMIEWLVIIGFISTLLGVIYSPLGYLGIKACYFILVLFLKLIDLLLKIPISMLYLIKLPQLLGLFFALGIGVVCSKFEKNKETKRQIIKYTLLTVPCLLFIFYFNKTLPNKYLKITYFDVNQGDSCLIETPKGKTILIDAGKSDRKNPALNMGKKIIGPSLISKGINKLDMVIITHYDNDHVGGLPFIIDNFSVSTLIDNGRFHINKYKFPDKFEKKLKSKNISIKQSKTGTMDIEKDIFLDFFSIFSKKETNSMSENNASVIFKLKFKSFTALFTGDLEETGEKKLVKQFKSNLQSDIYKCGHHGSKTSSSSNLLNAVRPRLSIISAGQKNRYGHPSKSVLDTLKTFNSLIISTKVNGAVEVLTDGHDYYVKPFIGEWTPNLL
jgi:competence protein ComEC